jgi:hypothetical protein
VEGQGGLPVQVRDELHPTHIKYHHSENSMRIVILTVSIGIRRSYREVKKAYLVG